MVDKSYIEAIKAKLDAMNKQAGIDPSQRNKQQHDPGYIDPLHAQGLAAIKYMEEQKKKNS